MSQVVSKLNQLHTVKMGREGAVEPAVNALVIVDETYTAINAIFANSLADGKSMPCHAMPLVEYLIQYDD